MGNLRTPDREAGGRPSPGLEVWGFVIAAIGVLVAIGAWIFPQSPSTPPPGPSTPSAPPETGGAGSPSATPTSSSGGRTRSPSPPVPVSKWLTDLEPVADDSEVTVEGVSIGGTLYERSLHYSCSAFCNNAGTSDLTYVLGKDYTKFRAVVGANDAAAEPQDGVFLVGLDGRDLKPVRVAQGHRRTIELDVRGVIRLRLRAYRPGTTRNPALAGANAAGGVSNRLPDLAWGDPRVSR
ncbi:NPCBM/NEW2 domain-containing protein [Actinomadura sp. BRA 177]|uniref:NPCBM/NEW2 domain-containing protein n=1 Tax=Actinomadura sp. BRA 177 TaxID=2745202 RepID=UPI0015954217|nr:NPCBM/NEW2 domain-containing protein [Actinomadura sp. BRA 177]NVI91632.1 NPCBM/NEW2 domain-containing protein [Actinomadura sp. BRA 177]